MTIAMVAEEAGVSVPTVSKVLNGRHHVGADTRRRVQQALDRTGYQWRGRSRGDRTGTGLVNFVISTVDTPWARELLTGAEQEAYRLGAGLVLSVTHDSQARPRDWMDMLSSRPTDGVVFVISHARQLGAERLSPVGTPLVVIDQMGGHDRNVPTIGASNFAGGFSATEHLVGLGHRRIGVVTGPDDVQCSRERLDGYRAALVRAGLDHAPELVRTGDFYAESGRRAAAELLDLDDPPTAVFALSDLQARGVYDEAHERGLRIPRDLSVVGFDDVDSCMWMTPRLTTVRQPLAQMAMLAVRGVLEPAEEVPGQSLRLELATRLVERESTSAPRRAGSRRR
ncbi:LacI family DNA-binding transcriptional regulator [Streptomyces sp. TS71-3]|uniref:LacI family DNA-binding transcriptional regulator n=1 Tax=Streptomyces sp. TS71-3 TaxID=2733862 RepID=UPI0020178D26|nr:LacI family DNA-binding transcriptional regulator [Streptomyces sp. TS71-3]